MNRQTLSAVALVAALVLTACGGPSEADMLASARSAVDKQDYRAAVVQLKALLQQRPQLAEARYLLGRTLLEQGDAAASVLELRKAAELNYDTVKVTPLLARAMQQQGESAAVTGQFGRTNLPDPAAQADLKVTLASAYLAQKMDVQAEEAIAAALKAMPQHAPARLLAARLLADQQQLDKARSIVDQVLAADAKSADAWMLKGELALNVDKDRKAAAAAFRKAVEAKPTLLGAHVAAVTTLMLDGDTAGATSQVAEMKKQFANHPRTRFFEAELAFNAKDYKAARDHIQPVVQALPNNVLALQLAGAAELNLGNLAQAENYLGKALQLQTNLPIARRALAQVYVRTGQPQRALQTLDPLLSGNPGPGTLQLAAEANLQMGAVQKAEQLYERASKLKPDDPRIRTALALSQIGQQCGQPEIDPAQQQWREQRNLPVQA